MQGKCWCCVADCCRFHCRWKSQDCETEKKYNNKTPFSTFSSRKTKQTSSSSNQKKNSFTNSFLSLSFGLRFRDDAENWIMGEMFGMPNDCAQRLFIIFHAITIALQTILHQCQITWQNHKTPLDSSPYRERQMPQMWQGELAQNHNQITEKTYNECECVFAVWCIMKFRHIIFHFPHNFPKIALVFLAFIKYWIPSLTKTYFLFPLSLHTHRDDDWSLVGVFVWLERASTHYQAIQGILSNSKKVVAISCAWCKASYHYKESCLNYRDHEPCSLGT